MGTPKNKQVSASQTLLQLKDELDLYQDLCHSYIRREYLRKLLWDRDIDPIADLHSRDGATISFPGNYFAVFLIRVEDINTHFPEINSPSRPGVVYSTIDTLAHQMFGQRYEVYMVDTVSDITGILCLPEEQIIFQSDHSSFVSARANELVSASNDAGLSVSVVFGELYQGTDKIRTAFQEATSLQSYRHIMGIKNRVLFCGDYTTGKRYQIPSASEMPLVMELIRSIEQGDYRNADNVLSRYVDTIMLRHTPTIDSYELQYYGFGYLMFLCIDTMRNQNTNPSLDHQFRPELLFRGLSFGESARRMSQLFHLMGQATGKNKCPGWINDVYNYVQDNFRNVNVNINTIAGELSMNPAYMSRVFRMHTGKSILELLTELRFQEAKRLILSGDSMEMASQKSGFGSTATMRRCFKRYSS